MLYKSSEEDVGALLQQYKDSKEQFEKNLMMLHIKSEGKISLSEVFSMTYKMRELYVKSHNEFAEEMERKIQNRS